MGEKIQIEVAGIGAVDGWLARPSGTPRGALVVIQEIFGVNPHIREVTDGFAADGYYALAPALFDPVLKDVELAYDTVGAARGVELRNTVGFERAVAIVEAAAARLRALPSVHAVGAVGYCWGGSVAFLANTRLGLPAVSYYGARTVPFLDETLRAPMLFHFGERDRSISPDDVELHRLKQPTAAIHLYPADHGFNRDASPEIYAPKSADLARRRTLEFFERTLR